MRWSDLALTYDARKARSSIGIYLMMGLSLLISVAVALAVPQVISSARANVENTAAAMVGADLKVITSFRSPAFDAALADAVTKGEASLVRRSRLYTASVVKAGNYSLVAVADGDDSLAAGEAAIGRSVASRLGIGIGDPVTVADQTFTVRRIEELAGGVDETAANFGLLRVARFEAGTSYGEAVLLEAADPAALAQTLKAAEPDFTYKTVEQQRTEMNGQLGTNLLTLNALSTMCTLTTVLSLFTCVAMILRKRQVDTAVMRLVGLPRRTFRTAFVAELWIVLLPPILVGAAVSPLVARLAVEREGIPFVLDLTEVGVGAAFFALMYLAFVYLVTGPIAKVEPFSVLKGGAGSPIGLAESGLAVAVFTAAMLLVYTAVLLDNRNTFSSSMAVMMVLGAFFVGVVLIIKATCWYRWPNKTMNFAGNQVRASGGTVALTIVSMALLLWFILFGFAFGQVFASSYNANLERSLSYNYLVSSREPARVAEALESSPVVRGWTTLYCEPGVLPVGNTVRPITVAGVDTAQYETPFHVEAGRELAQLAPGEALVSRRFADQAHLTLGSRVKTTVGGGHQVELTLAGIYDSGTVNDAYLLRPASSAVPGARVLRLVDATDSSFLNGVSGASLADVSSIGAAFSKLLAGYLDLFKSLCLVCVLGALIFNFNLIQLKYVDHREFVVVSAVGLPRRFLARAAILRLGTSFLLSVVLAVILFQAVAWLAVGALLTAAPVIPWDTAYGPAVASIAVIFAAYLALELLFIRRVSSRYGVLREQV